MTILTTTHQACNFRDGYKDFEDLGFKVGTTSPDPAPNPY